MALAGPPDTLGVCDRRAKLGIISMWEGGLSTLQRVPRSLMYQHILVCLDPG